MDLSADVRTITEPGAALVVGTVGADGRPRATRAFSVTEVVADATTVRVVMSADDEVLVGQLDGGRVAVTGSDVRTLKTVQLKGRVTSIEPPNAADLDAYEAGSNAFLEKVRRTDGNRISKMRRLLPLTLLTIEVVVEQAFDQSPGPAAGRQLALPR